VQVVLTTDEVVGSKWTAVIIIHSFHQSYMWAYVLRRMRMITVFCLPQIPYMLPTVISR